MERSRRNPPRPIGSTAARGGARAGSGNDNGTELALAELAPFMRRAAQDRDAAAAAVGEGASPQAKPPGAPAQEPVEVKTWPGSPFRLHLIYPPAGDRPAAIEKLTEGIRDGLAFQTLLGVTGSGKTYTMANVIARIGRPALLLAPNKTLAAQLYAEMREFFPENAIEYFVSYYDYYQPEAYVPSRDLFIEKDSSINEHIEQMRLSATKALLERPERQVGGHDGRAAFRQRPAGATTWNSSAVLSGCAATRSTSFRRRAPRSRCAYRCSTTRSRNSRCSIR